MQDQVYLAAGVTHMLLSIFFWFIYHLLNYCYHALQSF